MGALQWVPYSGCSTVGALQWVPYSGCPTVGAGMNLQKACGSRLIYTMRGPHDYIVILVLCLANMLSKYACQVFKVNIN